MKKITITGCSSCPHKDHKGGFGKVAYVPACRLSNKEIPHTVGSGRRGMVVASLADDFIPDWCELEDDINEDQSNAAK